MTTTEIGQSQLYTSADFWRYNIGVNVIPADTRNKTTSISWKPYQNSPVPQWQYEQWIKDNAFARGMAVIPGRTWHNKDKMGKYLICIDVDKRKAIEELCTRNKKTISIQKLGQKFLVEQHRDNPDKAHIYFYSPISFPKKSADSVLGLEVKGLGEHGIVFCSPSIHKDGYPYEIIGTTQPIVLNETQARELIQHLDQICIKYGIPYLEKDSRLDSELKSIVKSLTINHDVRIPKGQRHTTLISVADSLLFNHSSKGKKTVDQLKGFFDQINDEICELPLTWGERDSIWESALDFVDRIGGSEEAQKEEKESNGDTGNGDLIVSLTERIMRNQTFATMDDTGEIYHYDVDRGVYVPGGAVLIATEAEEYENRISTCKVNEIINKIRRRTYVNRTEFDKDSNLLNLKNGLFNIVTEQLSPHTPDYLSLLQLPINYDPNTNCPNILKFFGQVLRPKDVFTVLQLFGYCLYRTAKYEKAVICCGPGDNGKGTLLRLLQRFLGDQNVSHASIQELNNDRFAIADLHGKLANVCADLKAEKLTNTGNFKMLVSGDTIRAQKKHGQPFNFRNIAKLIFSSNEIPESDDQTYAYFKRWIILLFDQVFRGKEKDTHLIEKLTTEEELSGLLNLALIALKQLIKDNGFRHAEDIETTIKKYNKIASSVEAFLADKCRIDKSDRKNYTPSADLYSHYTAYCKENNTTPVSDNVFGSHLKARGIVKGRLMQNGERGYCYIGISLIA